MKIEHRISVFGILLAVSHLVFALWVYKQHYEGGWEYFPIAVADFPVTILLAAISHFYELSSWWFLYFVFGLMWWYLVGLWLACVFKKKKP